TDAYIITAGRGALDTVPDTHDAGAGVVFWGYDWSGDSTQYTASESLDVIMQPQLGAAILSSGLAPVDTVVMDSRAIRPYPPGDLKIDGNSYPPTHGSGV